MEENACNQQSRKELIFRLKKNIKQNKTVNEQNKWTKNTNRQIINSQ